MEQLAIKNVTFRYPAAETPALNGLSLNVREGELLAICGRSGCGKTTLLRLMKPQIAPYGEFDGEITFRGEPLSALSERDSAAKIGFVRQSPDEQIVTDKVWHELVFGLESLGLDTQTIRHRAAETASFFGIQGWFHKDVSELSGGQKQILNIASVMAMQPELLILDEPTSRLDPIAASELLEMLRKINRELGTTIILTEHDLEAALGICTRAAVMENGAIVREGSAAEICAELSGRGMFYALPAAARIGSALRPDERCPVSVNEGRELLERLTAEISPRDVPERAARVFGEERIAARGVLFRYGKDEHDVLQNADFSAKAGELVCILGGNGAGKTTLLKVLAGLKKPYRGSVVSNGGLVMLPQEPKALFSKKTVYDELAEMLPRELPKNEKNERISDVTERCKLRGLENRHPYDLSGGEMQRAALAKLLLAKPDILLADEPTKGLDAELKAELAEILRGLADEGVCVVIVSHDVEFCAEYADRCALFFDGAVAAEGTPRELFSGNGFYTTAAHRIARGFIPNAVTADEVIAAFGGTPPERPKPKDSPKLPERPAENSPRPKLKKKRRLSARTVAALAADLLLIPLTLWASLTVIPRGQYLLVSTAVLIECMLPFFIVFEGRRPRARELVLIAVLSALAIAGRAAFFMLAQFKPVLAVVIVAGAALGGEAGFLVGAVTMLVSNIMFSQGPWTAWQMFAAGIVGFIAGTLCHVGILRRTRLPLCIFGALSAVVLYGGIMNLSSALMMSGGALTLNILRVYILSGLPMDIVHGAATALFLWILSKPMLEKLERIKVKFGE